MKFNRRQFIKRIIFALASLEGFWLLKEGIQKKSMQVEDSGLFRIGKVETFKKGQSYSFMQQKFYLKRMNDGGFLAISIKCTHLGCLVNFNQENGGFVCPCHSSHFNAFGEVMSSPAPRPLDTFPIYIKNGELYVDPGKPQSRKGYLKSQLTYA